MTKLQLLHRALNERLMAAVEQIMEMVGGTVLEYEEETMRARKENEALRRRLRWMEGANRADWPGPSEPVALSNTGEANPSRSDEGAVNFGCGTESEALVIKTESTDLPLCSATTLPQSIDQGPDNAGTGANIAYGLVDSMTWDSAQSYMAPLDFDPTSGPSRVRHWRGQNRRQRMSFACPDCGKVFGNKQRLMVHMRVHSTERPYAYRRRKACFYGDNKKKRRLHRLSQMSREVVDDLSDGSEQMNRSSPSPETTAPGHEEEPESDHTSSDKEPEKRIATPVRNRREKKRRVDSQMCRCPHCPHRVFARPCQLAMHMKTHTVTDLVNLPTQTQSGTQEIVDVNRKLPKKQRQMEAKVADKSNFPCPECGKVFFHAWRLRVHMKSHKTKEALLDRTRPVKTELTNEETMEAVSQTAEVQKLKKKVQKRYACPHCDKVFAREGWLAPHIRTLHGDIKNKSDCFTVCGSVRTRSQHLVTKRLRKRKAQKQEANKRMRLNSQKTKGSRKNKPHQTSDESFLVVDVPTFSTDEDEESIDLPILGTDEAEESDLLKTATDESHQSADLPKLGTNEAQQSADLPKTATDEAQQSSDLPKTSEQSKDISDADCGTTSTKNLRFPCKICGKDFHLEKRLKKHSRKHTGRGLQDEKKRRKEQTKMEMEPKEPEKRKWEEKKRLDEMSTSNHKPNATQTSHGSPNKDSLRKSRTRGQGPLPCPFCGKVFAWEMRLLMHMQISHCGEKPYAYRQRKKRFYGDLKRGQLQKILDQEHSGDKSDESEESGGEETVNKDGSAQLNRNAIHAVPGAPASSTAIERPTTSYKSNQRTRTHLVSDIMSHFNMQPRIVLQPIVTACKYWSSVHGVADLKSGCSEKSSGLAHEETSVQVDDEMVDAVEDKTVDSNLCTLPVEISGHGIQNKPEICYTETEIVSVTVGSPQRNSEVELDKTGGSLAFESSEGNNAKSVSEKTTRDQVSPIVIDDEPEQSHERTAAENAVSECGRTKCDWKCDCKNISAMKLTVMPQSSVLQSLFKETSFSTMQKNADSKLVCVVLSDVEDNIDEDVLSPSKGLDKKKTASVPSIQNEHLDVGSTPGKNPSSDSNHSNVPAPDATDSTKSVDGASQHTDDQSISNDPVRDQAAFTAIRQTEDRPTSSKERISCQTSDMVSLSDVNADKKLPDVETVSSSDRKNKKLGLNSQMSESVLDDSTDNSHISGMNEPSVQNVKTNVLFVKSSEEFEMPSDFITSHQTSGGRCKTAVSSGEQKTVMQALYCRFCGKACRKIDLHLKCGHVREPEVVKDLTLDKDCKERKPLLSSFAVKKNFNQPRDSKMDCDEDVVHCIFCQESYRWNTFQEHPLICKHNKDPAASRKTQENFDADLGNLAPDSISMSRPLEPTNAPLSVLSDLGNCPTPETRIYEVKENHTLVSDCPQILHTSASLASSHNPDSCQSAALKTYHPEVEAPTVSNTDSSIAQIELDAQLLMPSVLDFCHGSAINPAHLESSFSRSQNVKILEPPMLDSCQTTQAVESTAPTLPVSNSGCSVLQQSLIHQTDHPRLLNQPFSSDPEVSCDKAPDGYSSCDTGCCDNLQFSSKPKVPSSSASLNTYPECNSESKCTLNLAVFDDTYLINNETEQTQDSDVERNIFMVSDVRPETESYTPDPNSCNTEQTWCPQPKSTENPDVVRSGNQLTADLEFNSIPSIQEIKSGAVRDVSYVKFQGCDLQEGPEKITDEKSNAVEVQHDSSLSVTSEQKRKRVYPISCLKEESKKSCPSSHSQGAECRANSTDDNSSIFKMHHCCYCKQPHHRMMDHLQSAHPDEPEVAKALTFDKSSQERKQLLNLLQTRGNFLHNTNMVQSSKQDSEQFGTFVSDCSFDDSVYCIHCLGLFNKKSFASHLEQCEGKCTNSAEANYGKMLPNSGPIPPTPTLISPSSPKEINANIEPSAFHCLNTFYEADFENEQGSSSLPDLGCSQQPDISSPNEKFRNNRQAEGAILQFRRSPKNEVGYKLNSGNFPNQSQESTDYKNEGVTLPKCDVDQERAMTPTSDTSSIGLHLEYDVLRNDDPCEDFSPPQNAQTVCNDTPKSSEKVQTYGTGRKRRRKKCSRVHNQSLLVDDDLLGGGELSNSKLHVCQHCKATFGSPYTLRRHVYTHTGERPFWCHQCNVGFIQKYRLLKHTFACHGDTPDQEKLKRAKRSIQDEETSVRDAASIEQATKSLEDLPNAVTDDTGEKVADTRQDTEVRELHWKEAEHSTVKDNDTDC